MTTPEERARAVVMPWWHGPYTIHNFDQTIVDVEIHDVAAAIRDAERDAVAVEREACALACEELTARRAGEMGLAHYDHLTGHQCVAAIRARGDS